MRKIEVLPSQVQLWWASLDVSDSEIGRLRGMLAGDELRRADRIRIAAAARRFIGARAALRMVLGGATGVEPAEVEFVFGDHGKPGLPGGGLCFNASDSGDVVVVALATAEVGVDIEVVRGIRRRDSLARRVCTDRELEILARTPDEEGDAMLLRLWTCKEAALKAVGVGLSGGARYIEVAIPENQPPQITRLLDEVDQWSLLFPDLLPDLLCSVVVKGNNWRAVSRPFSLQST
jgi:4'-phosphopantetheinyl transferase